MRTNSGEESLERWDSKIDSHGAGGVVSCWAVVDMLRRMERRRRRGKEAMIDLLIVNWGWYSWMRMEKIWLVQMRPRDQI